MGERHEPAPGVQERLGVAGYGGLAFLLAGHVIGGPGGLVLAGVGLLTTLVGALAYFALLMTSRPWRAREE